MLKVVFILFVLVLCIAPAFAQQVPDKSFCEANPWAYETFGPECVNPVLYNIPGLTPIGTSVKAITSAGVLDGVIGGYHWHPTQRVYHYMVTLTPPITVMRPGLPTPVEILAWTVAPLQIQFGSLTITFWIGLDNF